MNHFKTMASLVCIFSFFLASASAIEIPPRLLEGPAPRYDGTARALYQEGWVYLQFNVTTEGVVEDPKIIRSYPKGVFDEEALKAVLQWKFAPKLVDGVPTMEPAHRFRIIFAMDMDRFVTQTYFDNFRRALRATRDRDLADSEKYVGKLREAYEKGRFNLTEVARYYQFEAVLAIRKQDLLRAASWIEVALRLAEYLDNKAVVDFLHTQMTVSFIGLTQYHNAVDYYDSWRRETSIPENEKLSSAIEDLRKAGFGKGRAFEIMTYKEAVKKGKERSTKGGKVPAMPPANEQAP